MFLGIIRFEFEDYMICYFEYICFYCDYKFRIEGRFKRYIKDFYIEELVDGFGFKRNMGRFKVFRCK